MGLRQCDKCDEMVDEAKAFCPGCGNAFVDEEKRQDISSFEKLDNTVQLGQTMYNQMLSDMGLNVSKAAEKPEKRIEVIAPIETATAVKQEVASAPSPVEQRAEISALVKWIIIGVAILFFGLLVLFAVGVLFYWFMGRA